MLAKPLGERSIVLNTRAYARAHGNFELTEALADIDEAIQVVGEDNASYIDTRGFVLYKLGRYKEALVDLERAISLLEQEVEDFEQLVRGRELRGRQEREYDGKMRNFHEAQAVMHQHRGDVHKKLGDTAAASKDFIIARELGYDPAAGVY
jgi:tetratricopeptide (TPR) repeat protein